MKHLLWIMGFSLLCIQSVSGQDPPPPPPGPPGPPGPGPVVPQAKDSLVGPAMIDGESQGDGTKANPFAYLIGSKGKLTLAPATQADTPPEWNFDDGIADTEILPGGKVIWFPTDTPGEYHVICASPKILHAWILIKGPNGPPVDDEVSTLSRRVKAAFKANPTEGANDAASFKIATDGLVAAMEAGKVSKLTDMIKIWGIGLNVVKWKPHVYPDMTAIAGQYFGDATTSDRALTATDVAAYVKKLKTISAACAAVK